MSMQVIPRPAEGVTARRARTDATAAWLLDPIGLNADYEELFIALSDDGGLERFRTEVTALWRSTDPVIEAYLHRIPVHSPEEWELGFDEAQLGEWFRVLMGRHVQPARGLRWPVRLKERLPDVGWMPGDARRLVWGRELAQLGELYATNPEVAAALAMVLPVGNKGFLTPEDLDELLDRFRSMDAGAFRDHQFLVPVVEDAFEVLSAAAVHRDRVLLLVP
jgi:hypothetical protein